MITGLSVLATYRWDLARVDPQAAQSGHNILCRRQLLSRAKQSGRSDSSRMLGMRKASLQIYE